MCTNILEKTPIIGSGKGPTGWFKLKQANVFYDHPFHTPLEDALGIDFWNEELGWEKRVTVELSGKSARSLMTAIATALDRAESEFGLDTATI